MKEKKPVGYWSNKTNCRRVANKCKSKSEMQRKYTSAYMSSVKNGWIDEFFQSSSQRGKKFWTKENCREEAKKYKTRGEFSKKCNRAYRVSLDNGWLEEFGFPKVEYLYTKEMCEEIASGCANRDEFYKKNPKAYNFAKKNRWLIEFFGKKDITYTKTYQTIKNKYKSPSDLKKRAPSMYKYAKKHHMLGELFPNSTAKDCQIILTYDVCKEEASKYSTRSEFKKGNYAAYMRSMTYDWLNDFYPVVKKTKVKKIWTKEECAEIAAQCNGRLEFCKKKASAYRFAQAQGWLDEFFGISNKSGKEYCREIASHYKKSSQFKKFAPATYKRSLLAGWMDEFFPNEVKEVTKKEKTIRSMILDYVEANGSQTKKDLYRVMLTIAGQNINRKAWGVCYLDNVSYGTSVFLPTKSDKRYLKMVRGFDPKTPRYDIASI